MVKRILLMCVFLVAASLALKAQNVVTGTVIDRDGNPIPGAKVEIVGSAESTITELDGTFSITTQSPAGKVRVVYGGMQPKVKKVKPDMVIKLRETSWWKEKPEKMSWFVGVQVACTSIECMDKPSYGLMAGQVKQWGWYVKGVYRKVPDTSGDPIVTDSGDWVTGEMKQSYWSVTGGVIVRLGCPIHFYLGAGYSKRDVAWQRADGSYSLCEDRYDGGPSYDGLAVDAGLMLKMRRIFVNGGVTMNNTDDFVGHCVGHFGVGVFF